MIDVELFLGPEAWDQSWLLNAVDISSDTETFSGIVTAEDLEWVDPQTIRCLLHIESHPAVLQKNHPSVITSNTSIYPNIKRLSPSAGTSWPIPDSSELLVCQGIAIGSLYNKNKADPVQSQNATQHILRAHDQTEFMIDDESSTLQFKHQENKITLTDDLAVMNPTGNILLQTARDIHYQSQGNTQETCENNYTRVIKKRFHAQADAMHYRAKKNLDLQADNNFNLSSAKNIMLESATLSSASKILNITSRQTLYIQSLGAITIRAEGSLMIMAEENIKLNQNGNSIEINKDGTINFNAPTITVSGQPILSVKPTGPA